MALAGFSNMKYPQALQKLIESFQLYPGIGPKTAERLALFTFMKLKEDDVIKFSQHLLQVKTNSLLWELWILNRTSLVWYLFR